MRLLNWSAYARRTHLPPLKLDQLGSRPLIFAAHPDDETLGCAGLIKMATDAGAKPMVAIVSAGEGFTLAICRQRYKLKVSLADRIHFATLRQSEALLALQKLGVPPDRIVFLGFPETGLAAMWLRYWHRSETFYSPITKSRTSPFPNLLKPRVAYHADEVLDLIQRVVNQYRPTAVFLPHRNDDHIAHWATNCLITAALLEMRVQSRFPKQLPIFEYLIHYGSWPQPQGRRPSLFLRPPRELSLVSNHWRELSLPCDVVADKESAIKTYASQRALTRRFMSSFIRASEVYEYEEVYEKVYESINLPVYDHNSRSWAQPPTQSGEIQKHVISNLDRAREPFRAVIKPSADLRHIKASLSEPDHELTIRLELVGKPSAKLTYQLHFFIPSFTPTSSRRHIIARLNSRQISVESSDSRADAKTANSINSINFAHWRPNQVKWKFEPKAVVFSMPYPSHHPLSPITLDAQVYSEDKLIDRSPILVLIP